MSTDAGLSRMLAEIDARRADAAARYAALDWDECQLCRAVGADKRTLRVACFYAVHEVVPEAIDMRAVDPDRADYLLRICKSCRGRFLGMLGDWRAACLAMRSVPKDHDGHEEYAPDDERCIPVRVNGAIQMLTREEWAARSPNPNSKQSIGEDTK